MFEAQVHNIYQGPFHQLFEIRSIIIKLDQVGTYILFIAFIICSRKERIESKYIDLAINEACSELKPHIEVVVICHSTIHHKHRLVNKSFNSNVVPSFEIYIFSPGLLMSLQV